MRPPNALMAELVDAHGSGPCTERCGGSSPLQGTTLRPLGYAWRCCGEDLRMGTSLEYFAPLL